jgi:hypothetical protein
VTVTVLVAVLFAAFGSLVVELTEALPEITVLPAVAAFTLTTSVNVPVPPLANAATSVQVTVPAAPAAGFTQVQPAATVIELKVVLVGVT